MVYKCTRCGETYDPEDLGKEHYECAVCGFDLEEYDYCSECYEFLPSEKLFSGYCIDCLRDSINALTAERYLSSRGCLVQFLCCYVWDVPDVQGGNERFQALCLNTFVNGYKAYRRQVEQFILDDSGRAGIEDYAEWYSRYRIERRRVRSG